MNSLAPPPFARATALGLLFAFGTALACVAATSPAPAQTAVPNARAPAGVAPSTRPADAKPAGGGGSGPAKGLTELGSSKEPIAIDADKLDVYDKEGRAVFTGNVVAVQGDTTMNCKVMVVFYEQRKAAGGSDAAAPATTPASTGGAGGLSDSSIKKIDCAGPVTIVTKTQTATGDRAEFDRVVNKVFLIGNAVLSDGPNVTRGERVAYDLSTGVANVEGGRVRALIVPGSDKDKDGKDKDKDKGAKPKSR